MTALELARERLRWCKEHHIDPCNVPICILARRVVELEERDDRLKKMAQKYPLRPVREALAAAEEK